MSIISINIKEITVGYHPRQNTLGGKEELTTSISQKGVLRPITVRKENDQYFIIDGLRRFRSVQELGLTDIPCVIETVDRKLAAHLSWIRNTDQTSQSFNAIEEAGHLKSMRDQFDYRLKDLVRLGYAGSVGTIYNKLSLLTLPDDIQQQIANGEMKCTVGYKLAKKEKTVTSNTQNPAPSRRLRKKEPQKKVANKPVKTSVATSVSATPYKNQILHGDCLDHLRKLPDNSVDQLVTDPPYGLKFMGKDWDKAIPSVEVWRECLRVLKPGAFGFILSSPRQDLLARMYINLEKAGFETNFTSIYWTYATGFPKAHSVAKAIEKKRGAEYAPTDEYQLLEGAYSGFQPKPAVEVIIVVMKPISKKTYIDEAITNRKGITWFDDCRIPFVDNVPSAGHRTATFGTQETIPGGNGSGGWDANPKGRFSANLLVSDDVLGRHSSFFSLDAWANGTLPFLVVPKANKSEKEMGLEDLPDRVISGRDSGQDKRNVPHKARPKGRKNNHATVKPVKLMAYLITMGSRPGALVLDPFAGSGTTGMAAKILNRRFIGMDINEDYCEIARARISSVHIEPEPNTESNEPVSEPVNNVTAEIHTQEKKMSITQHREMNEAICCRPTGHLIQEKLALAVPSEIVLEQKENRRKEKSILLVPWLEQQQGNLKKHKTVGNRVDNPIGYPFWAYGQSRNYRWFKETVYHSNDDIGSLWIFCRGP